MKPVGPVLLAIAGLVLGWIALATDSPARATSTLPAPPEHVPTEITGVVPDGCVVRSFELDGLCCTGCAGKLYVALHTLDEVHEVAIDADAKRAQAVVPRDFDVAKLEDALTFDKYSAHLAGSSL